MKQILIVSALYVMRLVIANYPYAYLESIGMFLV